MQLAPTVANALWAASNWPAHRRFCRALKEPRLSQRNKLCALVKNNADTAFGKAHGFSAINNYADFVRRVPLCDYGDIEPWIDRIRRGEQRVLTRERITHLTPTSGSTGGRKLIPFTAGLQREFNAGIGAWLVDLIRQIPGLLGGRAYWSITPVMQQPLAEESVVPIGFEADTAYLGGNRRRWADMVMAVPASVGRAKSLEAFRYETLLHLLLCRDLRLISVWHPSFLTLLLDALPQHWERLLAAVRRGTDITAARPDRAAELCMADPLQPETLWPSLRIISCWGDGAAALPFERLRKLFGNVLLQPKGLIATEAFVTLPLDGRYPAAVCSHFFEFIDDKGRVHPVEALRENEEYEVVITTAGGLWRYRLGDRVRVDGMVERTPSLKFLGRNEGVCDIFGEKLTEPFVTAVLRDVFGAAMPRFALLAPDRDENGKECCYTLYVEGRAESHWPQALDCALRRNPQYAYCRDLGQLSPVRLFLIADRGFEAFAHRQALKGAHLGDIKPAVLSRAFGWSEIFSGSYVYQSTRVHRLRSVGPNRGNSGRHPAEA